MKNLSQAVKQYLIVTGNYWAFTLTDGALRMLVVLHFYQLGYGGLEIASLFLFYEFFGIVTNLVGGWLGARIGLNKTMNIGLALQVIALAMLAVPSEFLIVPYVMFAQALSGIAKDLNKMSAKSSIKGLVKDKGNADSQLYRWVAILTGSKNALKGAGFFLGGALLSWFGFQLALAIMAGALLVVFAFSLYGLQDDLGKAKKKPKFNQLFAKSREINYLSAARLCLFAARDIWFVIALPLYLASVFSWQHWQVGAYIASWVIGYGIVQGVAPKLTQISSQLNINQALFWVINLTLTTLVLALLIHYQVSIEWTLLIGLMVFGVVFAVNSSLHSYLIVKYADKDGTSLDVGFYYMANAAGRLLGTLLSGYLFQVYGFAACLWGAVILLTASAVCSIALPKKD
ncbi:organoarsenical effux MFS transporter ArsJ [Catenovulum sp. SM1970]|uniref:organoarsenical effux MFS transporter ArsJ n=1 Tax=Marinifaba aquimaris TaxID=2741323 RepID=UPI00157442AC|nr:organoarsenical effux MFS transporter ArsJ [Marinifaba aquimaris]NTS76449.1 organoarsenical effux MFS transporter ArsJ [Marinifaba aquimaris]